jgi:glutathione-regulated potassium-efflux system ancillary protein KefG
MKILILFAHPAFHKSKVNKVLVDGLSQKEGVTFHDLYQEYPELDIDVKREQELIEQHDVIVFHFPLFWYSTPAILKEWQDLVLQHGWAFGSRGNALKDKVFFCVITVGGPKSAYQVGSFHNHTLNQLLAPLRQSVLLCKMKTLPPFVIYGCHDIEIDEVLDHRNELLKLLDGFINGEINTENTNSLEYLNNFFIEEN